MYGWRSKFGLIVPSMNTTMEADFWRLAPQGVSVSTARMHFDRSLADVARLEAAVPFAHQACIDLATAGVDAAVYGCTSGSFFAGAAWDDRHAADLSDVAGFPVITTARASADALLALSIRRVCIVTPYGDAINALFPPYLEHFGIEVVSLVGRKCGGLRIEQTPPEHVFELVREGWDAGADGLFVSCTNLPALDLIPALEADLGVPVVTSNQASFWALARVAGIAAPVDACGRLFGLA